MKLYKAQWVRDGDYDDEVDWEAFVHEPEGWHEHCLAKWGEHRPFFFPSDRRIYRSRSSAQERVDLINRWGGSAVLVECDVDWVPVEVANEHRRRARVQGRIERLRSEIERLERTRGSALGRALAAVEDHRDIAAVAS